MAARLGGEALDLFAGDKPYVVDAPGHVELEVARCRTAVSVPLLDQLRPEALKALSQLMQDDRPTATGLVLSFCKYHASSAQTTETAGSDPATYEEGQ